MKGALPTTSTEEKSYRIAYAVHKILSPNDTSAPPPDQQSQQTQFIGLLNLTSLSPSNLLLPSTLNLPPSPSPTILTLELGYGFLPRGWGAGYATESIAAVLSACRNPKNLEFWAPYTNIFVRAIVNIDNPASVRVMEKVGLLKRMGEYVWRAEEGDEKGVFLAGRWWVESTILVFGGWLVGGLG